MLNMIILVVFALIGLVVGYLAISIKLRKAKEQEETILLKAGIEKILKKNLNLSVKSLSKWKIV